MNSMKTIKLDVADGIGWLVINRPERMNSMTNQMLVETHDCLATIAQRTDVRVRHHLRMPLRFKRYVRAEIEAFRVDEIPLHLA